MIDETVLSKGQIRKLTALRKSLGNEIADKAFAEWQKTAARLEASQKEDPVALSLLEVVTPIVEGVNLGRYGYTIRRTRGGLTATRNTALVE